MNTLRERLTRRLGPVLLALALLLFMQIHTAGAHVLDCAEPVCTMCLHGQDTAAGAPMSVSLALADYRVGYRFSPSENSRPQDCHQQAALQRAPPFSS